MAPVLLALYRAGRVTHHTATNLVMPSTGGIDEPLPVLICIGRGAAAVSPTRGPRASRTRTHTRRASCAACPAPMLLEEQDYAKILFLFNARALGCVRWTSPGAAIK